jgi:peptidoglycan/LPS O-acetylase OafA/YrhL
MGALAAIALRSHTWKPIASRAPVILMIAGFCGFASIALFAGTAEWTAGPIQTIGSSFANICFTGLVLYGATAQQGLLVSCLRHPLLTSLGRYSYCLYVVHIIVIQHIYWLLSYLLARVPNANAVPVITLKLAFFVAANAVCYYIAKLSWNVFESPILALKERFGSSHDVRQHRAARS